ncbi:MAG TPA: alginate export family protein [Sphingomonas sp.]|jgi:hypothetical protein|nr:alginate export family protein [Sphingomonas sp.]
MKSTLLAATSAALLGGCLLSPAQAQTAPPATQQQPDDGPGRPANAPNSVTPTTLAFAPLPYDEDYTRYADPTIRDTPWAKMKYIPIAGNAFVSLGGEFRPRVQYLDNLNFGRGNQEQGFDVQLRSRVWADVHATSWLRVFGELQSGVTRGLDYPAGPVDTNPLEIHQGFVELSQPLGTGTDRVFLRLGRQEIAFGKSRLIDTRNAANTRRSFQAARVQATTGAWRFGGWIGHPLRDVVGTLNDPADTLYDVYMVNVARKVGALLPGSEVELLYIHTDHDAGAAVFRSRRDTVSVRLAGREHALDYDVEAVRQTGRTADGRTVDAWFLGVDAAYQLAGAWQPRVALRADVGSGDTDPNDGKVGSFDFLFGRGMTLTPELGYTNLISAGPAFGVKPSAKLSTEVTAQGLWRTSTADGLYNMGPSPVRGGAEGRARYVGLRSTARVEYQWNRLVASGLYVNRTFAGDFLKETGDGKSLFYSTMYALIRL